MAEQLKPCPAGHEAGEPHGRGWPDQGWIILCLDEHCGWEMSGDSREDVICRWNDREPGPATKAMLAKLAGIPPYWREMSPPLASHAQVLGELTVADILAFLAEWAELDTPPASEQPASVRTMRCNLCGEPVLMSNQAQLFHAHEVANHEAELSNADIKKILRTLIDKLD